MINLKYHQLLDYVRRRTTNVLDARTLLSVSLGLYVGRRLGAAPTPLNEVLVGWMNGPMSKTIDAISRFNECTPIDSDLALEYAKECWMTRQTAVGADISYLNPEGTDSFFDKLFGVRLFFTEEQTRYINANSSVIATVINRISGFEEEMGFITKAAE